MHLPPTARFLLANDLFATQQLIAQEFSSI
jgi:hypothetical protein